MKSTMLAAVAALALTTTAAAADSKDARHFLKDAMEGDNSEVMLGQLAAKKGASEGTRAFGQMLAEDHAKGRADAGRVAGQLGVPQTDEAMPEAMRERMKLEGLSGPAFDREFARYMAEDHTKDIAKFKKAAQMGGPAGDLAKATLPTLEKHLAEARKLGG
ncbi:DUF4142 domain-containing protein [Phenylobacterium sp.]|jgi:putative membrane protein|uniref:DUF4142 domain-containing protein n=1 Tax=Phenylobacterium sp. TaxID=1871053 RepID=UPI002F3F3777